MYFTECIKTKRCSFRTLTHNLTRTRENLMTRLVVRSDALQKRFRALSGANLDLTRGKPSDAQVALCAPMFSVRVDDQVTMNYGNIEGCAEARALFSQLVGAQPERTFVSGSASLSVMYNIFTQALARPLPGERYSWNSLRLNGRKPVMLCPSPGYDRHHNLCRYFGIEMIPVPLNENGPDMEVVLENVKRPQVVGMWCVPIYSNPSGITYSSEVCQGLAKMETACTGFRIIWDLAYVVHHLTDGPDTLPNMLKLCREAGHEDRVFMVASTSKITCPDAGLGTLAGSERNMCWYREGVFVNTIGQHKRVQLQHARFFGDLDGIRCHMRKHREILQPKLEMVQEILKRELGSAGIATWNMPHGGYFVGLTLNGVSARRVEARAASGGLKLTPAGSSDPTGKDDSFLRIAWTYPPLEELRRAMEMLALSVLIEADQG